MLMDKQYKKGNYVINNKVGGRQIYKCVEFSYTIEV